MVIMFVSSRRIDEFHKRKSIHVHANNNYKDAEDETAIQITDGIFVWNDNDIDEKTGTEFSLSDITININRGKLIAIVGMVGSGKSSLIQAILGEMKQISGYKNVNLNQIVYCSQVPYEIMLFWNYNLMK